PEQRGNLEAILRQSAFSVDIDLNYRPGRRNNSPVAQQAEAMPGERNSPFKQWLSRPPRPHGAIRFARRVSFLELFYDLVYVAVIGQASHQLAQHVSVRGAVEFAI